MVSGDVRLSLFLIERWQGVITNCAPDEHECVQWVSQVDMEQLELARPAYEGFSPRR